MLLVVLFNIWEIKVKLNDHLTDLLLCRKHEKLNDLRKTSPRADEYNVFAPLTQGAPFELLDFTTHAGSSRVFYIWFDIDSTNNHIMCKRNITKEPLCFVLALYVDDSSR